MTARSRIIKGDCLTVLRKLPEKSVQTCVTSPPYWGLRDYGMESQLGLEKTPDEYVAKLVEVFREVRRVLKDDGTLWLNLGDSYAASLKRTGGDRPETSTLGGGKRNQMEGAHFGSRKFEHGLKPKDLVGIPWRVAFALQADGWYLRSDIIWHKPNCMPSSVRDRPTMAHEYIFLLSKSRKYFYDAKAVREDGPTYVRKAGGYKAKGSGIGEGTGGRDGRAALGFRNRDVVTVGRNRRSVWTVSTKPFKGAHFATFPPDLIRPCILAGSAASDVVLDPFAGAGTTCLVAKQEGRKFLGIELNPQYAEMATQRIAG